jgi:DNA topoisomerase-6 subunit B
MYAQLTTGKPVKITSRVGAKKPAHYFEMRLDTQRNMPVILTDKVVDYKHDHGTRIHLELQGTYKKGRHSVDGYLQQIALANPHASIFYHPPKPDPGEEIIEFPRVVDKLPREALEILPHPYGVELGVLLKMAHISRSHSLVGFLSKDFSRVSTRLAEEICKTAGVESSLKPEKIHLEDAEKLYKAILNTKIMAPSANCLSPIGEEVIQRGLEQNIKAAFYACVTRSPSVYRGNPFQIEVGVAWGGDLPGDGLCALYRFANRVPLQYQQAACAITKAVNSIAWSSYGVQQSKGALPTGPLLILIHIASVWVPFTSESKEAIAHYPEILKELRLAIQECARKLQSYLRRRQKEFDAAKKKSYIEKYIPHIGIALREILSLSEKEEQKVVSTLKDTLERSRG